MQKIRSQARAGHWKREFGRHKTIGKKETTVSQSDVAILFRFFNEIGIISQLSQNLFESVLPGGLTLSQFSVLNHFVRLERTESPARLANAFQVTKGAMTNTLGRLEKRACVAIKQNPDDGRAKLVDITEVGRQVHKNCIAALGPLLKQFGAAMDINAIANATGELEKARIYLDKARE